MSKTLNPALQTLIDRGFVHSCTDLEGLSNALDKESLRFYCGFDPTGPSLHIGHVVPLFAMAHLARAGHQAIALIGGGTARIGDPSGKSEMRKIMSYEQIDENAASLDAQIKGFLNSAGATRQSMFLNNSQWLANLNYIDFLRTVGAHFSVNRMLSFETYKMRYETGLSFIEFNYQILQSYDFYVLNEQHDCRLQIGGADQWGNIVAGADLIRRMHEGRKNAPDAFGLTFNLITRSDGKKMGKTESGSVFLDPEMTPPFELFQYWRNIPDADIGKFLRLFTFLEEGEIRELESLRDAEANKAKERLAWEYTQLVHGKTVADECLAAAHAAFSGSAAGMHNVPSVEIAADLVVAGVSVLDLAVKAGFAASKGDARRLIQQGGLVIGERKIDAIDAIIDSAAWDELSEDGALILRAGKKRIVRVLRV